MRLGELSDMVFRCGTRVARLADADASLHDFADARQAAKWIASALGPIADGERIEFEAAVVRGHLAQSTVPASRWFFTFTGRQAGSEWGASGIAESTEDALTELLESLADVDSTQED